MKLFFLGMLAMANVVAAVFFLRYWKVTNDRLFAFFAWAFAAQSVNWVAIAAIEPSPERQHYVYLFRLLAFVLIIVGIIDKNRRTHRS